jgi:hypothetical protein
VTTPFEHYFATHFQTSLNNVGNENVFSSPIGSIKDASWDRKAAYLLWCEIGRPGEKPVKTAPEPAPPSDDDWDIL